MKNKHIKMLKVFLGVLKDDKKIIRKIIPDSYKNNIKEIDYDKLLLEKRRYLIFDVDNTVTKVDDDSVSEEIIELFKKLKEKDFEVLLLSNNTDRRVETVAKKLHVLHLSNAGKPKKSAFDKALATLKCKKEEAAMIGDQMLSDIVGANEYGIYSILVDPVSNENNIQTGMAKFLQDKMAEKLSQKKLFSYGEYY